MKERILSSLKTLASDRYLTVLLSVFILLCIIVLGYLAISIKPSELQVVVHYTSFGNTNFYRDRWYYLVGFAIFVVLIATVHSILTFKLLQIKGRNYAASFIWMSIGMIVIAAALFYQVIKIASLS